MPTWEFAEETFLKTAESFDNPDFAAVVRHSYMHRTGEIEGDPRYADLEEALCAQPQIRVPAVILLGEEDTVTCPGYSADDDREIYAAPGEKDPSRRRPRCAAGSPGGLCAGSAYMQTCVRASVKLVLISPIIYNIIHQVVKSCEKTEKL